MSELLLHFSKVEQVVAGCGVEVNEDINITGFGIKIGAQDGTKQPEAADMPVVTKVE